MFTDTFFQTMKDDYEKNIKDYLDFLAQSKIVDSAILLGGDDYHNKEILELTSKYKNIYGAIGISPISNDSSEDILNLYDKTSKIIAIGEVSLNATDTDSQEKIFIENIALADTLKLPIIVNSNGMDLKCVNLLKKYRPQYGFLYYSPTLNPRWAQVIQVNLGGYICLNPQIKNLKSLLLERYLIGLNNPNLEDEKEARELYEKIKSAKKIEDEQMANCLSQNMHDLFPKKYELK